MPTIAKVPFSDPCPVGTHLATLTEVEDLDTVETQFGSRHMVRLKWSVVVGEDTFDVARQYNLTLHPDSALTKDLTSWLDRDVSKESGGFDLETLLDTACRLVVTHHEDGQGRVWARVEQVLPAEAENPLAQSDAPQRTTPAEESTANGIPF